MTNKPTVTIIMATYNRAKFIEESLITIQNQTYNSWECLIIDDDGNDDTAAVIAPILENDKRFQYIKRTDQYQKGLPGCRNYGLDLAQGEYIIFFDDDDIAHPQNLEICVLELSNTDLSFCRYIRDVFRGDFVYDFD
jgi:GalNAc5-diNAcBac-PP-undecaprenol beta-1,3-glucosyltransferase